MCEEGSVSYNNGDVVWVKLGPCWWPGEIVSFEELPSDITESFKKPPLAVVKFFEEEKYEFIKQLAHIHSYNSNKKYEFIKKGLDLHRAKNAFMDKFPKDVCAAEAKTNGDPNILNDPKVGPEKKLNYSSIFGSPVTKKKGSKDSSNRNRSRNSTGKNSSPNSSKRKDRFITHPRFLGKDDSEIRILVQTPLSTTQPPESEYKCYTCDFKTSRIDVIVLHNKYHQTTGSGSTHSSPKKTKKSPSKPPKKRIRKANSKTTSIEEDLALLRQGLPICSDHTTSEESTSESDEEPLVKRKPKAKSPPKPKKIKTPPAPEVKTQTDIRTDLLAEWDDDEEDEEPQNLERVSPKPTVPVTPSTESKSKPETSKFDAKDKSCFDFVEDEEDLLTALEGRKIPRVIPPTDKRKSIQDREDDKVIGLKVNEEATTMKSRSPSPKISEDNVIESESEKSKEGSETQNKNDDNEIMIRKKESQFQLEFEAFNNALRETTVPEIHDIPPFTKYEQNFHNVKTIKFPDKPDEEPNNMALPSPAPINNENAKVDQSKQLETNKIEPVLEIIPEPIKEPVVRKTEVATKLTNPKKRFVKTFEDETKNSAREETVVLEKKVDATPEPVKTEAKSLEVSKLKTQLMKKLVEASPKKENIRQSEKSKKTTPKGRRFNIISLKKDTTVKLKDSKRTIIESASDNESKTRVKKKRYSIEEDDSNNELKQIKSEEMNAQKPISSGDHNTTAEDYKISQNETNNMNQLEYLNSSPTKIFRELHIDKDELVDVSSLSESQKLTIQNIIGVSSPILTPQQSLSDKSNSKEENMHVEPIFPADVIESKDPIEEILKINETNMKEENKVETTKSDENVEKALEEVKIDKLVSQESDEISEKTTESTVDHITASTELYQIEEKLSTRISENLPEEIIEGCSKEMTEDSKVEKDDENLKDHFFEKSIKDIEKPLKDEDEISIEEKLCTLEEKVDEPNIQEQSKELILEEKIEVLEQSGEVISEEKIEASEQGQEREKELEVHVDVEAVKELDEKSEDILKEISNEAPDAQIQDNLDIPVEKLMEEKVEEEVVNKSEESKEEMDEKLANEKVEHVINESADTSITDEHQKETEISVEAPKDNIDIAPNNLTIDKKTETPELEQNEAPEMEQNKTPEMEQNETSVHTIKEDSVSTNDDIKKDFHLPLEPFRKSTSDLVKSMFEEEEMVNIEGNLTVVTETDLADKQVEIATTPEVSKPITLANFSMDFCEDVESYVKGETIMQNFGKDTSVSLTDEEVKIEVKDDVQKDANILENVIDTKIDSDEKVENVESSDKDDTIKEPNQVDNADDAKPVLDIKNEENIENEGIELNRFENIITPAKEVPPAVIMEGFEEAVKEDIPEDALSIDETSLKVQIDLGDVQKSNLLKDIATTSVTKEITEDISTNKDKSTIDTVKLVSQKEEIIIPPADISVESEVAKITDSIVEQEVVIQDSHHNTSSTKLLEILTDKPKSNNAKTSSISLPTPQTDELPPTQSKVMHKPPKFLTRQATAGPSRSSKATILSDKLIKPLDESKTVSVKKVTSKRSYQDVEDIDTYIIQKPVKKLNVSVESDTTASKIIKKSPVISKGKARILQQTIITPTGDILQPPVSQSQTDDNMFDINSMPIVLSDQILTPESIENMQIVLQENTATTKSQITPIKKQTQVSQQQMKLLNKTPTPLNVGLKETILKSPLQKQIQINKQKLPKVYPSTPKIVKHNPSVITQPGKQGKFIIVPATTTATGTKYTVGKRPAIVKKPPQKIITPVSKAPEVPMTSSGNKIMILKSQGQQQKILLGSPQKQFPQAKGKGRTIHKQIIAKESSQQKGANIISQTILNSKGQITTLANQSPIGRSQLIASLAQQSRNIKIDPTKMKRAHQQRIALQNEISKPSTSGQQRTIIIKNPQGQTVKKIQGTDDALLDQQVAEQLQAISRASANQLKDLSPRTTAKLPAKKPFLRKQEVKISKNMIQNTQTSNKNVSVPPLAPISPAKKVETHYTESSESTGEEKPEETKRQPHQLVIQDAQGNQTTITEGQILALPSEAIEGQPHSYVLVTLDETGNLTPLNSEALMSLDPNLNLTSDLGNMVLQIDQGVTPEAESPVPESSPQPVVAEQIETTSPPNLLMKESVDKTPAENVLLNETPTTEASDHNVQAVINSGEMGQLIITGDAATAQKFLESLAEGNADLANLLANAEGNVLIQADGQQILINTDSENPMLVMNPESISNENSEGSGNPIFASQPVKNQDILAAALADTDVFQQDQSITHSPSKVAQSQLSPNSSLYPMNVGNVLETNSMNSPIMTPLEVPSTNSKKIDDENEILNQVPKNVDLPITITDPNISQTVAQQQVASLIATELPTNLDLPLAIQDPGLSVTSTEMNSPSFVYSLPTLDDTVDINQKAFSGSISMPLLTEEPDDPVVESSNDAKDTDASKEKKKEDEDDKKSIDLEHVKISEQTDANKSDDKEILTDEKKTDFINSEGLCAMRGGICNSLSEPPPDMFDFSIENQPYETPHITENTNMDIPMDSTPSSELSNTINDRESSVSSVEERKNDDVALYTANTSPSTTNTDDSCEIPVQPPIIAKPFEENGTTDSRFEEEEKTATDGDV